MARKQGFMTIVLFSILITVIFVGLGMIHNLYNRIDEIGKIIASRSDINNEISAIVDSLNNIEISLLKIEPEDKV